jgi:hypothetical protein
MEFAAFRCGGAPSKISRSAAGLNVPQGSLPDLTTMSAANNQWGRDDPSFTGLRFGKSPTSVCQFVRPPKYW